MVAQVMSAMEGRVAVLTVEIRPQGVESMASAIVTALCPIIERALADVSVSAILLQRTGKDLPEHATVGPGRDPRDEWAVQQFFDVTGRADKPIVAALTGNIAGQGLELALASHYRVATPDATMRLPQVKFGVAPSPAAIQRLTSILGVAASLRLLMSGEPIGAGEALAQGLITRIVDGAEGALELADAAVGSQFVQFCLPDNDLSAIAQWHARIERSDPSSAARQCILDRVKASALVLMQTAALAGDRSGPITRQ